MNKVTVITILLFATAGLAACQPANIIAAKWDSGWPARMRKRVVNGLT